MSKMRILQVAQKNTFPPYDGGKLAMLSMAKGLKSQGHSVEQFFASTPSHPALAPPPEYPFNVYSFPLDTRPKAGSALVNLWFSNRSYNVSRFSSEAIAKALEKQIVAGNYDIVQAESIYGMAMLEPIRSRIKVPVICRAHNAEHLIWQRKAEGERNPFLRSYFARMAVRLRHDELNLLSLADAIVPISEVDLAIFRRIGFAGKAFVSGVACDLKPATEARPGLQEGSLFHLGAMNWLPNLEAVDWFVKDVWPVLHQKFPELTLKLAGHSMPERFKKLEPFGIFSEAADDAAAFMERSGMMIVPLRSGSGIRVKIIEGLSLGKVIISTTVGVEGIQAEHGKHLLIADTADEFVEALQKLTEEPELAGVISKNARIFAQHHFHPDSLAKSLAQFYQTVINA